MGRLFGTDGVRGIANSDLTCELALKIGRAAAEVLSETNEKPKVLIGTDTRISSNMLESAIAAGLCSVGADVMLLGVVPTPAIAYLVKKYKYDAGVMISASHNPFEYNGIKIFKSDGYKLPDEIENKIEDIILDEIYEREACVGAQLGKIYTSEMPVIEYIEHVESTVDINFEGLKIALDCANGSSSITAAEIFMSLGADCIMLADSPDGININHKCGSTYLEGLRQCVLDNKLDAGFAFDGDADRMLAIDSEGNVVDGDKIIAICAVDLKERGLLKDDTAVVTVMSNMGFFQCCKENNIRCETTKVGDRYVLENMVENGYKIGGEQSGHVIFLDYASTGDGQLTAVQVLQIMKKTGKSLKELASIMEVYPQVLINVKVSKLGKIRYETDEDIKLAIEKAENELGESGRVLVRVSGTEPLVRIMLEGKDEALITKLAEEIAEVVREKLI